MFCQKCGKEISDDSTFCVFCGSRTNADSACGGSSFCYYANQVKREVNRYNIWSIAGFILAVVPVVIPLGIFSLITGISAIIISSISLKQIKNTGEKGNVLAILGIIFGAVFFLYGIFLALVFAGLVTVFTELIGILI